ncbi:MAG: toll/interleukin-1 receptor domain-containing protein [Planctomycetaceae bacterium]|nr:toll/interleukin-1 receptor domain-containing protein [Planctomycetaceae bacterium]MCB9951678.1 toll/interleukin-1 receptor domain-containing protein [Planctomycetaceae bacterium]
MADVFLSYAREDHLHAGKLYKVLTGCGFSVWWDNNLRGGDQISSAIKGELSSATCVVVLWSKNSSRSEWVEAEANEARKQNKLVSLAYETNVFPIHFEGRHNLPIGPYLNDGDIVSLLKLIESVTVICKRPEVIIVPPPAQRPWAAVAAFVLSVAAIAITAASLLQNVNVRESDSISSDAIIEYDIHDLNSDGEWEFYFELYAGRERRLFHADYVNTKHGRSSSGKTGAVVVPEPLDSTSGEQHPIFLAYRSTGGNLVDFKLYQSGELVQQFNLDNDEKRNYRPSSETSEDQALYTSDRAVFNIALDSGEVTN